MSGWNQGWATVEQAGRKWNGQVRRGLFGCLASALILTQGCRDSAFLSSQEGNEGGPCHADGTCNIALQCEKNVCIAAPDTAPVDAALPAVDAVPPAVDAGATDDAMPTFDAGGMGDAVPVVDAGGMGDATPTIDAGGTDDATPTIDAGGTDDATLTADAGGSVVLIDCTHPTEPPISGDIISRGFYTASFPGISLSKAVLSMGAASSGSIQLSLTARAASYDGTLIGVAFADVALTNSNSLVSFDFANAPVTPGSTVTFKIERVSGPSIGTYYAVGPVGAGPCGVTQTEGTSPPLDSWRRDGIWIDISGLP